MTQCSPGPLHVADVYGRGPPGWHPDVQHPRRGKIYRSGARSFWVICMTFATFCRSGIPRIGRRAPEAAFVAMSITGSYPPLLCIPTVRTFPIWAGLRPGSGPFGSTTRPCGRNHPGHQISADLHISKAHLPAPGTYLQDLDIRLPAGRGPCLGYLPAYGPLGYLQVMPAGHQISQGILPGISHGMLPARTSRHISQDTCRHTAP